MYQIKLENDKAVYFDLDENRKIIVDKENFSGFFEAGDPKEIINEQIFLNAVLNPVKSGKRLRDITRKKKAKTACIIISDITRGVPTERVIKYLIGELNAGGVSTDNITFFVALGVHRNATVEEMKTFVGDELYDKIHIENHEAFDERKLIYLGETSRKTPVKVNRKAYECDIKVTVGKVELHEMAGFSGGRKSILPGISSEETILVNHRPEMIFDQGTGAGCLEGNPIHEDMLEVALMFGVDFSVNFVVNNSQKPAGVFAGALVESHLKAVTFLRQFCDVKITGKPDIFVITPGSPLNCDLYQGIKALIAMHHVLSKDSVVVLYGNFPEGVNSHDFLEPLAKYKNLDEARKYAWDNYKIQMDHTLPIIDILKIGTKIIICSENVSDEEIKVLRMIHCRELGKAMKIAFELSRKGQPKVAFCPHPQKAIIKY